MTFWRKKWIESNSECILYQRRYDSAEDIAINNKTRIKINLDQIWLEIPVDHKIESKKLKVISSPVFIETEIICLYDISHYLSHLLYDVLEVVSLSWKRVI